MNETEEPKVWMPGVSPALFESQSAELTKLKSDVERLRKMLLVSYSTIAGEDNDKHDKLLNDMWRALYPSGSAAPDDLTPA